MILLPLNENTDAHAPRPRVAALVSRAHRLGGIADHRDAVLGAHADDGVEVARLAVEVGGDDRLGQAPGARPLGERIGQQVGIEGPGGRVAIEEHRRRAFLDRRPDRADERQARRPHLVARPDAQVAQRQVHGRGAAGQGYGMREARIGLEVGLEGGQRRPDGGDVVRCEGGGDLVGLAAGQVRRREEKAGIGHDGAYGRGVSRLLG